MPIRLTTAMPRFTGDPRAWRDDVRRIEDLGFHGVCISDHLANGWVLDPLVAMSWALEATSTLEVHSLVLNNDFRHPALLHKAMATMEAFSAGRVGVGLGAGWLPSDYDAVGIDLDPASVRIDRLAESAQVLRGLFAGGPIDFVGKHYRIRALDGLPMPVRAGGPPILVGGGSRAVAEVAGRYADRIGLNPRMSGRLPTGRAVEDLTRDRTGRLVDWTRAAAADAGREPGAVGVQLSVLALDLTGVPGAVPWRSSLAVDADPDLDSPAVLLGPVGACAEQLLADAERFGIEEFHLGGDPATAAALLRAVG